MDSLLNALKGQGANQDQASGTPRFGLVTSVDPATATARVTLQPEGVLRLAPPPHALGWQWLGPRLPTIARRPSPGHPAGGRRRARPHHRFDMVRQGDAPSGAIRRVLARPQLRQLPQAAE
jgi:hypothetical protein